MVKDRDADSWDAIERDLRALLFRARALGVAEGKRDVLSSFMQFAGAALPSTPTAPQSPEAHPAREAMQSDKKAAQRSRAPHGQVQQHVRKVIEGHPSGIAQRDIIPAAATLGFQIKPSSMRMALPTLEKAGVIEMRDGKWFPKGNGAPEGAPLFNPRQ
jgi:hypothetical protein